MHSGRYDKVVMHNHSWHILMSRLWKWGTVRVFRQAGLTEIIVDSLNVEGESRGNGELQGKILAQHVDEKELIRHPVLLTGSLFGRLPRCLLRLLFELRPELVCQVLLLVGRRLESHDLSQTAH